jgi:hypothetical protein
MMVRQVIVGREKTSLEIPRDAFLFVSVAAKTFLEIIAEEFSRHSRLRLQSERDVKLFVRG